MKKLHILAIALFSINMGNAQIIVTPNQTATTLVAALVATSGTLGITVSNQTLICDTSANGEFTGVSNLGITDGIVLASGTVYTDPFNINIGLAGHPSLLASNPIGTAGDTDLTTISGATSYDACVLEFDLQPVGSNIQFEYVFGSEEYTNFNCSPFNDVFGFFISGPGFSAPTNIALVPSTTVPVSINSINDGTGGCAINTALYVNNIDTFCTMNGFTVPLLAQAAVTSGATYHLKLAVADVSDGILNSYVIIKSNSLKSSGSIPTMLTNFNETNGILAYPTSFDNSIIIQSTINSDWDVKLMDLSGLLITNSQLKSQTAKQKIGTQFLAAGTYFLHATRTSDNRVFVQQVIKH
jgi:hypothetical protein